MSIDLTVATSLSGTLQPVMDQNGTGSALSIATNSVSIVGQDVVGEALPMALTGSKPSTGKTWGRLLRLTGMNGTFFDLGIDASGIFFINAPNSTETSHALTISPTGTVTIGNLRLPSLTAPSGGSIDVVIDPATGVVHKQS